MPITSWLHIKDREEILKAATNAFVVWDFDGVIANSEPIHAITYQTLLKEFGVIFQTANFSRFVGLREEDIWETLLSEYGISSTIEELKNRRRRLFLSLAMKELHPSWLILDLTEQIQNVAINQVVLSNGDPETIRSLISHWGLSHRVEYMPNASGSDKSTQLKDLLAKNKKTVVFEDNEKFLQMSKSLGAYTIQVEHAFSTGGKMDSADVLVRI